MKQTIIAKVIDFKLLFVKHKKGFKHIFNFQSKKKFKLLVAAIDFGTTYSGYAFLTKDDFEAFQGDNSRIHCPTWQRDGGLSHKAPTSVLFRPNKTFHSFGFEAEKYYHENSDNNDFKEWYFFKHFKMKLYTNKVIIVLTKKYSLCFCTFEIKFLYEVNKMRCYFKSEAKQTTQLN